MHASSSANVEEIHVGSPRGPLTDWVIKKVHFHEFARLPTTYDEPVCSPEFSCFGRRWLVKIKPGGKSSSNEGHVAVFLRNRSSQSIQAYPKMLLKHPTDRTQRTLGGGSNDIVTIGAKGSGTAAWGCSSFAKRELMLTYLNNGTLTLEVHLRTVKKAETTFFVPPNPCGVNVLEGFNNEEMSDVAFEVGGEVEDTPNRSKRARTTATTFRASYFILKLNAPLLADMCRPGDEAAVPICGVEPDVFKMLLYFCYGGAIGEEEISANAKAIVEAADRFGIVNLKLQAEVVLTKQTEITVENMLDNLLYADSKNLALFREKVMDFVAENGDKIIGKVSFDDVVSSSMSDLLTDVARGKNSSDETAEDDFQFMRVGELRKKMHDRGLCIDGSREAMISLLRENSASDSTGAE